MTKSTNIHQTRQRTNIKAFSPLHATFLSLALWRRSTLLWDLRADIQLAVRVGLLEQNLSAFIGAIRR